MAQRFENLDYLREAEGKKVQDGTFWTRLRTISATGFFSLTMLLAVGAVIFSIMFFLSVVDGGSMMNTLNASQIWSGSEDFDKVVVNQYATAKRGDIIVVRHYWDPLRNPANYNEAARQGSVDSTGPYSLFIKRVIAIADDEITFRETGRETYCFTIELNGAPLVEPYMADNNLWRDMNNFHRSFDSSFSLLINSDGVKSYSLVVPKGHVFFMGDNRQSHLSNGNWNANSFDCREIGPQSISLIEGIVADIIPSTESIPSYVVRKLSYIFTFKWLF